MRISPVAFAFLALNHVAFARDHVGVAVAASTAEDEIHRSFLRAKSKVVGSEADNLAEGSASSKNHSRSLQVGTINFAGAGFGYQNTWRVDRDVRLLGDVNGDGRDDIVGFHPTGVYVGLGNAAGGFDINPNRVTSAFGNPWDNTKHIRTLADVNGDGMMDIVGFGEGGVYVARSKGDGTFRDFTFAGAGFGYQNTWRADRDVRLLGDVNGDGRADIVGFHPTGVYVGLGNAAGGFDINPNRVTPFFGDPWDNTKHIRTLADVNGDGMMDIVGFGEGGVYVACSKGDGTFRDFTFAGAGFGYQNTWRVDRDVRLLGDVNGDGRDDIVGFHPTGVYVGLGNNAGGFDINPNRVTSAFGDPWVNTKHIRTLADVNGDGMMDIVGFGEGRMFVALGNSDGKFEDYTVAGTDFTFDQGWRVDRHVRLMGDVNGDGRDDIVGFGNDGVYVALGGTTTDCDTGNVKADVICFLNAKVNEGAFTDLFGTPRTYDPQSFVDAVDRTWGLPLPDGRVVYWGENRQEALAHIAAFLGQAWVESLATGSCDERNIEPTMDSNPSCGQRGRNYQLLTFGNDYGCPLMPTDVGTITARPTGGDTAFTCGTSIGDACCWWGRGITQTTGRSNYMLLSRTWIEPYYSLDLCGNPGLICDDSYPELRFVSGLFVWMNGVVEGYTGYDFPNGLTAWVNAGMDPNHNFVGEVGGLLNLNDANAEPHDPEDRRRATLTARRAIFGY